MDADTIVALSSPPGAGRRGVVRLSGPAAGLLVAATFRPAAGRFDPSERAALSGRFHDARGSVPALCLWMPGPASYTREDIAELHLPGAEPLLLAALEHLLALGARAAAPGEFTRRAFANGRLDLARVEGVLALVSAGGEAERRAAQRLLAGGLSDRVAALRARFVDLRCLCEASLDFDEADTGHVPASELLERMHELEVGLAEAHGWEVERLPPRSLARLVLVGPPNAGKSSLFNALVSEGAALVSRWAGTTRDHLVGTWELGPGVVLLVDTPGLDPTAAGVDARAQALALEVRATADAWLHVLDASAPAPDPGALPAPPAGVPRWVVWNQVDRPRAASSPPAIVLTGALGVSRVSARTGAGLAALAADLATLLGLADGGGGTGPGGRSDSAGGGLSRELFLRHRRGLEEAALALAEARRLLEEAAPLDLVAEELRAATGSLDALEGRTTPEDLLDRIFARFCLGK